MRFGQCRATFLRSQALTALVIVLAACGQERPSDPVAPFSRDAGDTVAVLRAVASTITEMNAGAERLALLRIFPRIVGSRG